MFLFGGGSKKSKKDGEEGGVEARANSDYSSNSMKIK